MGRAVAQLFAAEGASVRLPDRTHRGGTRRHHPRNFQPQRSERQRSVDRTYLIELKDSSGTVCATVEKLIYIRKR
jgi:hypothetical protein